MDSSPRHFSLPFITKEQVAKDTYTFSFAREEQLPVTFSPGQFVRMVLSLPEEDPRSNRRYFTISSSPLEKEKITITTKIRSSSSIFKQKLFSLQEGERVQFWGPTGAFTLPEDVSKPLVFLAGGIGMTPFHSMITYLYEKKISRPITLLASFETKDEMVFYEELDTIALSEPQLSVIYTLTSPEEQSNWLGERGRIGGEMIGRYVSSLQESMYYVSGPIPFVRGMIEIVQSFGITEEMIKRDNFTGY